MASTVTRNERGRISGWHITSRVVAALIPGFVLTNTSGVFLALAMPGDVLHSVATATLLSFVIYCVIVMWVFSVERLKTVWLGMTGAIVATSGGAWLLYTLQSSP
ncbi:MAG: iron transporter [Pseudomonadota bacterium]